MTTSPYFSHINQANEQALFEDLVIEYIQMNGIDIWYVPRVDLDIEVLLGEPKRTLYEHGYLLEAIIDESTITADDPVMSKFGLRINSNTEIMFSKKRFLELGITGYIQPRAGDLIYVGRTFEPYASFINTCFEINHVAKPNPNGFGAMENICYKIFVESFTYNHEKMQTGIPAIDETMQNEVDEQMSSLASINQEVVTRAQDLINFDVNNPFGDF